MNRNTGNFPGGIQSRQDSILLIYNHFTEFIGRDPTHRIMGCGLDRHGIRNRVNSDIGFAKINNIWKFIKNIAGSHPIWRSIRVFPTINIRIVINYFRGDIHMQIPFPINPATVFHFQIHRPADDIPGSQIFHCGGVPLHKTLPLPVYQHSAFTPDTFRNENAHTINTCWVELEKFHIFCRNSSPQG